MSWSILAGLPNPIIVDAAGTAGSGYVLKAFLPGTTTSTSLAIDSTGSSPQTSITANADGIWEVSGNEVTPYIDRKSKWGIFANATDAAANTPFYMGPFNNVDQLAVSSSTLKPFLTLAAAVADDTLADGNILNIKERTAGNGGGAFWDVVLSSTVTENTFDIVQSTGVGTLSLVLRVDGIINIAQVGAVGDGTTDDGPAFRAAVERLNAEGGGEVFFPSSNSGFVFTAKRNFDIENVIINGNGQEVLAADPSVDDTTRAPITFIRCKNIVVKNLRMDGRFSDWTHTGTDHDNHNISFADVFGLHIFNCTFKNSGFPNPLDKVGDGVYISEQTEDVTIENNVFIDNGRWAITCEFATTNLKNIKILNNVNRTTDNSNTTALGFIDFELANQDGLVVEGLQIVGNVTGFQSYMALSNATFKGLIIRDNNFRGEAEDGSFKFTQFPLGVFVNPRDDGNSSQDIQIIDNTWNAIAGANIIIRRPNLNTIIRGNRIVDDVTDVNSSFTSAIDIQEHTDYEISDNYIKGRHNAAATFIISNFGEGVIRGNKVSHELSVNPCISAGITDGTGTILVSGNDLKNNSTTNIGLFKTGVVLVGNNGNSVVNTGFARVGDDIQFVGQNNFKYTTLGGGDPQQDPMTKQLVGNDNNMIWFAAIPTLGTWQKSDIVFNTAVTAGGKVGWVPTVAGTFGTLNGGATTGGITSGTNILTVNDATDLKPDQHITIVGVTGVKRIRKVTGLVVTITVNADATVAGAAVAYSAPTFKTFGDVTA